MTDTPKTTNKTISKKIKIAHIVIDDKFTDSAYDQFETTVPRQSTYFLVPSSHKIKYIKRTVIQKISINSYLDLHFIKYISRYHIIIFHSLTKFNQELAIRLKKYPIKKIWVGMGYDYYDLIYKDNAKLLLPATRKIFLSGKKDDTSSELLLRKEYLKKKAVSTIDLFCPVLSNEYSMVRNVFPKNFQFPQYAFWNYCNISKLFNNIPKAINTSGYTLLGNSATPTNNHLDIILSLPEYFFRHRKILSPLNYGQDWYADVITKVAKSILGRNFQAIHNFLPFQQYIDIISKCNTVIMNHIRQQATGNVYAMLFMGAAVFLRQENPLYKFCQDNKLTVFSVQDLEKNNKIITYRLTDREVKNNKSTLSTLFSFSEAVRKTRNLILQAINIGQP